MFQKIIKSIKKIVGQLESDELAMLGSSLGLILLGFVIYGAWQVRLSGFNSDNYMVVNTGFEEEAVEEIEKKEEEEEKKEEKEEIIEKLEIETPAGYKIVNITDEIIQKSNSELFGIYKPSLFTIEYQGVTNAIFENERNLSLDNWIEEEIIKASPRGQTLKEKKELLDILIEREKSTSLGRAIEVVRMNNFQSAELFISFNGYILSFYYEVENAQQVFTRERSRDRLLQNIK